MSEEIKKKRGRPLNGPARKNQFRIMLTDEEVEALKLASEKYHMSKSDIIRSGMKAKINLLNYTDSDDI